MESRSKSLMKSHSMYKAQMSKLQNVKRASAEMKGPIRKYVVNTAATPADPVWFHHHLQAFRWQESCNGVPAPV